MTIVEQIKVSGVRGIPRSCHDCIVARFMRQAGFQVIVTRYFVVGANIDVVWKLPDDVRQFALDFDQGKYPELEEQ